MDHDSPINDYSTDKAAKKLLLVNVKQFLTQRTDEPAIDDAALDDAVDLDEENIEPSDFRHLHKLFVQGISSDMSEDGILS
jgi:hypothetical protein